VADCPLTPVSSEKPPDEHTASFTPRWYKGADGKVWASANGRWYAGSDGAKVLWAKPKEGSFKITGRRLDGAAPPLDPGSLAGYDGFPYQASGLIFPTAGCWEVEGRSGASVLRFVTYIYPGVYHWPQGSCQNLLDTVNHSAAILLGKMEGSVPAAPGFAWQTVRETKMLKGHLGRWNRLEVLQDIENEIALQPGTTYVLFLTAERGAPWRILCGDLTLARVDGERLSGVGELAKQQRLWQGDTLAGLEQQLDALMPTPTPRP
jgi:hypothetical protein